MPENKEHSNLNSLISDSQKQSDNRNNGLHISSSEAKNINKSASRNLTPSQNSYDAHVKSILEDAQKIIKTEASSREQIRWNIFKSFKHYFWTISIVVIIFIYIPLYSVKLKEILLSCFFANIIGLLIIIFHYAFSSSKNNYNTLIGKLLEWALKRHKK